MNESKIITRYATQLRDAGFKATKPKVEILTILAQSKKPLSVNDIFDLLKNTKPDLVTVYRCLKDFHAVGLVRKINVQQEQSYYEYAGHSDHHHFICSQCGLVEDIKDCDLGAVINYAIRHSKNFKSATEHSFEIFGVCRSCG